MYLAIIIAIIALVLAVTMKPKSQSVKPASLDEIEAPVAEIGREICVVFGERDVDGPNVVWYGDLKTEPVKKKP